jgi:hypothetical protein
VTLTDRQIHDFEVGQVELDHKKLFDQHLSVLGEKADVSGNKGGGTKGTKGGGKAASKSGGKKGSKGSKGGGNQTGNECSSKACESNLKAANSTATTLTKRLEQLEEKHEATAESLVTKTEELKEAKRKVKSEKAKVGRHEVKVGKLETQVAEMEVKIDELGAVPSSDRGGRPDSRRGQTSPNAFELAHTKLLLENAETRIDMLQRELIRLGPLSAAPVQCTMCPPLTKECNDLRLDLVLTKHKLEIAELKLASAEKAEATAMAVVNASSSSFDRLTKYAQEKESIQQLIALQELKSKII